jgi:hypothetical protein
MNYFDLYSSYPDRTIAAAWDSQVKEADTTPWLTECGSELFTRFAAYYAELRALPRSARRALQRQLARSGELAAILPDYLHQGGRRLQHRMAWSVAGAALLLALGQGVGTAATITVTTNDPNIAADGQCSLIEAIVNANNDAATFPDCAAGNRADTIVLPANANLMLSAAYSYSHDHYWGPVGLPPIASRITIEGNGATISRQGNAPAFGLIFVKGSNSVAGAPPTPGDLTLQYVTLSGGTSLAGGLSLAHGGTASIKNSIISGNGLPFPYAFGVSNGGTLTIENSVISSNGDGVNNGGTLTIERSTISGNTGSGLSNGADLAIENSTISSNSNGGVTNSGHLTIANSTISGNTSNSSGGGVSNSGTLIIENSTISGNRANHGGGVSNSEYCYFVCYPGSGILTLNNSLIAGNQAAVAPEIENLDIVNANHFNLFGANGNAGVSGFTPGTTDIVPSVPLAQILGPLQNNGGPTQTHALVAGSPAIDAGDPNGCRYSQGALLQSDQRGFPRDVDGNNDGTARCDIGAIELNSRDLPFTLVAAVLPSSRSVQVGTPATAFATIINTDSNMATGCAISPISNIPATLTFQTTDPATNQVIGAPNALIDIPAGVAQSFVFALTPTGPMAPTDIHLSFDCANTDPAPIISGLNTLLFSASATPTADIMALVATLSGDGIVNIPGTNGTGIFAVATVNMGSGDTLTVSADTGDAILPVSIFICQTDPQTSACLSAPANSVTTMILTNETPTFGIFVAAQEDISFFPEINRIFVRFMDSGGVTRGLTSVAVRTQ